MPREIPDVPKGWKPPQPDSGRSYEIELITPMFGGGVSTRVNDPSFPIRPTSIRGQLQFWWRATVGAQYATRQELRVAQSAVWGDTTRASLVQIRVDLLEKPSEPKACAVIKPNHKGKDQIFWEPPFCEERKNKWGEHDPKPVTYALFPFQGKPANSEGPKVDPASCIHKAKFRLTLICPDQLWSQVEPALWAWVNFGGLGSRTRRGCGAVLCKALAPKDADELKAMWVRHMPELFPQREWPTLAHSLMLRTTEQPGDPIPVWSYVIGEFRHFRQGEDFGRNPGQKPNRPGRSRYSEPETIRRVTGQRLARHARLTQIPDDAFPRAELGLPIVFHFQEQGDPPDTVLYPDNDSEGKKRERMASPLILKPLALQSGKAVPLILRLKTPALTGVDLRIKKKDLPSLHRDLQDRVRRTMQPNDNEGSLQLPVPTRLVDPSLSGYPNSPLNQKQFAKPEDHKVVETGAAIDAFLAFARAEDFKEVTR